MVFKLDHSVIPAVSRWLPRRHHPAWLIRHLADCPVCRAARDRQARLDLLLRQGIREEARALGRSIDAPAFAERLWARIEQEGPAAPTRTRLVPSHVVLGIAALAGCGLLGAWWTGFPAFRRSGAILAQRSDPPLGRPRPSVPRSGEPAVHLPPDAGGAAGKRLRSAYRGEGTTAARRWIVRDERVPSAGPGGTPEHHRAAVNIPVDDLSRLNGEPPAGVWQATGLPREQGEQIEARVRRSVPVKDDFVTIPFPRLAAASDRQVVAATEAYQREAAVVDGRLAREVTVGVKATALSDLCERMRSDTGIQLVAGSSVADEKVTVFCQKQPLRDVMRQLGRPFGYTWLRSRSPSPSGGGAEGRGYRYELVQDLKSQLLEEELRNRDQNAALVDMEEEAKRYRAYADLSPDEALARAATAAPEEKKILEHLAGKGWGPAQLYFRLTPADHAALRAGRTITFSASPGPGEQPLPPEMAGSVIASLRDYRIVRQGDRYDAGPVRHVPDGLPVTAFPEAQPIVSLNLIRSELGQISLQGLSGFSLGSPPNGLQLMGDGERNIATGISPTVRSPRNAVANAALVRDPDLRSRISVRLPAADPSPGPSPERRGGTKAPTNPMPSAPETGEDTRSAARLSPPSPSRGGAGGGVPSITTADALEALHRATGLCIVSDYYTRLYRPEELSAQDQPSFDAINRLADAMRMRWRKDGKWLQFRSASFFNDRLKEVPNRLLDRWAAARRRSGTLTLEEMVEIAQLSDAQLDAGTTAEGARLLYGLVEWSLASSGYLRPNWRYLAGFSPEQRRAAQSAAGLPFVKMSLAQQQRFLALALGASTVRLDSLEELSQAALRVEYVPPLGFQLAGTQTTTPFEHGLDAPRIWGPTREAALVAARQIDPTVTKTQIIPARLSITFTYRLGGPNSRLTPMIVHADSNNVIARQPQPVPANR